MRGGWIGRMCLSWEEAVVYAGSIGVPSDVASDGESHSPSMIWTHSLVIRPYRLSD